MAWKYPAEFVMKHLLNVWCFFSMKQQYSIILLDLKSDFDKM